jgi:hypothetical protein
MLVAPDMLGIAMGEDERRLWPAGCQPALADERCAVAGPDGEGGLAGSQELLPARSFRVLSFGSRHTGTILRGVANGDGMLRFEKEETSAA